MPCSSEIPNGCEACGPSINLFTINRSSAIGPWGFQGFGGCPNKYANYNFMASIGANTSSGGCRGAFKSQASSNERVMQRSSSDMKIGKYGPWLEQTTYYTVMGTQKSDTQWWDDPETPQEEEACNSNSNWNNSTIYIIPANTECNSSPAIYNSNYSSSSCTSCLPNPGCNSEGGEYLGGPAWAYQGLEVKSCTVMVGNGGESWSCEEPDWNNPEEAPPCEAICGTFSLNVNRNMTLGTHVTSSRLAGLVSQDIDVKANIAMINGVAGCDGNRGCAGDSNGCWSRWVGLGLPSFNVISPYNNPGNINSAARDSITLIKLAVNKTWFHENLMESVGGRVFLYYGGSGQLTPCCDGEDFNGVIAKVIPFEINTEKEFIKHGFGGGEFYATENDLNLSMKNSQLQDHINQTIEMCISIEKTTKKQN